MSYRRIPIADEAFSNYLASTATALAAGGPPPTYERLGLTVDEYNQWDTFAGDWKTLFPLYVDLNTRTKTITDQKNAIKSAFMAFASTLLDRMNTNVNLTLSDRNTFRLKARSKGTRRGAIDDIPFGMLQPVGPASVRVRVRMSTEPKRSRMNPLANGLEIRYIILSNPGSAPKPTDSEPSPSQQQLPPTDPLEMPLVNVSTRALFTLKLPSSASGKRMYAYIRWVNQSNPKNNGEWSTLIQTNVL